MTPFASKARCFFYCQLIWMQFHRDFVFFYRFNDDCERRVNLDTIQPYQPNKSRGTWLTGWRLQSMKLWILVTSISESNSSSIPFWPAYKAGFSLISTKLFLDRVPIPKERQDSLAMLANSSRKEHLETMKMPCLLQFLYFQRVDTFYNSNILTVVHLNLLGLII